MICYFSFVNGIPLANVPVLQQIVLQFNNEWAKLMPWINQFAIVIKGVWLSVVDVKIFLTKRVFERAIICLKEVGY